MHYSGDLDNPANHAFREAYNKAYGKMPNVFSVQGYDAAELIIKALTQVGGDTGATGDLIKSMAAAEFPDSPRGPWRMSAAHNPIQDIYLREVRDGKQKLLGVAAKDLEDPAEGCNMA